MKKIMKSILVIGVVALVGVVATRAYLTDTEKSSDNTFVAGEFDLKIDSDCSFKGAKCICHATAGCYWDKKDPDGQFNGEFGDGEVEAGNECSCKWDETDLEAGTHKFFDLANLLPGDYGEATISLHVIGDDAWFRLMTDNLVNHDNGCNKPECIAEGGVWNPVTEACTGTTCGNPGSDVSGELGDYLMLSIWIDDGDNIFEEGELLIVDHMIANEQYTDWVDLYPWYFEDCETYYFGVAWCVGDMTLLPGQPMVCDGSNAGNIIQSDSFSSDATYEVEQRTNNLGGPSWMPE